MFGSCEATICRRRTILDVFGIKTVVCCECSPLTNPEPIDFRPADLGFRQTPSGLATGSPFGTAKQTLQAFFAYSNGFQQWVSHWSLSWFQRSFRGKHRFSKEIYKGFVQLVPSILIPRVFALIQNAKLKFKTARVDFLDLLDSGHQPIQWCQRRHRIATTVLTPQKTGVTWIFCVFTGPGWRILPSWSYILSLLYIYMGMNQN